MNDTIINGLMIMGSIACIIWLIQGLKTRTLEAASPNTPIPAPSGPGAEFAADAAVIAAAIYTMLGCYRVVHIEDAGRSQRWVADGRWMHQMSHRLR